MPGCHEMSCSVMRPSGIVIFCHGPPRLRFRRRPGFACPREGGEPWPCGERIHIAHRSSVSVLFHPPADPARGGPCFVRVARGRARARLRRRVSRPRLRARAAKRTSPVRFLGVLEPAPARRKAASERRSLPPAPYRHGFAGGQAFSGIISKIMNKPQSSIIARSCLHQAFPPRQPPARRHRPRCPRPTSPPKSPIPSRSDRSPSGATLSVTSRCRTP